MSELEKVKERLQQLDDWVAVERKYLLKLIALLEGGKPAPITEVESCTT